MAAHEIEKATARIKEKMPAFDYARALDRVRDKATLLAV